MASRLIGESSCTGVGVSVCVCVGGSMSVEDNHTGTLITPFPSAPPKTT